MIFNVKTVYLAYNHVRYCFAKNGTPKIYVADLRHELLQWCKTAPDTFKSSIDVIMDRIGDNQYCDIYTLIHELPLIKNDDLRCCLNAVLVNVFYNYINVLYDNPESELAKTTFSTIINLTSKDLIDQRGKLNDI